MKPTTIGAAEFKARCFRLLDEVAERRNTFVITKRGKPVAKFVPLEPAGKSIEGSWADIVEIEGDILNFDTNAEWEVLRDDHGRR